MDNEINLGRKGQLAIWVIIAMVIVALIFLLFFLNKTPIIINPGQNDVSSSIEKCARDSVNEAIDKMLPQGGLIEPENYKVYKNTKVVYICQEIGYFKPCINQHPMLINEEINEIYDYTLPRVEECFNNYKAEMQKRNYDIEMNDMQLNISLASDKVYVYINRSVKLSKNGVVQTFDDYDLEINNPLYDLSKVAIEIASNEAKYCYFEYVGYMVLYPRFGINKFAFSDATKIYTIKDKNSDKEMNIAIRGCVISPGP